MLHRFESAIVYAVGAFVMGYGDLITVICVANVVFAIVQMTLNCLRQQQHQLNCYVRYSSSLFDCPSVPQCIAYIQREIHCTLWHSLHASLPVRACLEITPLLINFIIYLRALYETSTKFLLYSMNPSAWHVRCGNKWAIFGIFNTNLEKSRTSSL